MRKALTGEDLEDKGIVLRALATLPRLTAKLLSRRQLKWLKASCAVLGLGFVAAMILAAAQGPTSSPTGRRIADFSEMPARISDMLLRARDGISGGASALRGDSLLRLSSIQLLNGDLDGAQRTMDEALPIEEKLRGPKAGQLAKAYYQFARLYVFKAGQTNNPATAATSLQRADDCLKRATNIYETRAPGVERDLLLGECLNFRSLINTKLGRADEAEKLSKAATRAWSSMRIGR
jgi:hypothetical protein